MIRRTPLVSVPALGPGIALKMENLQVTGSFKARGAVTKLSRLSDEQKARGVITASAGNHGLGVAMAAGALGIKATVVVPEGTPDIKRHGIENYGAEVVVDGAGYDAAAAIAHRVADETGAEYVSAYDDEDIIAGNGDTLALELLDQSPDLRLVVCCVGGGGLMSGLARTLSPRAVDVVGVQPENNCAMKDSLRLGRALTEYEGKPTCAEGCEGATADRTYQYVLDHGAGVELVSEDDIQDAVAFAFHELGTIVECSGAVALAGIRSGSVRPAKAGTTAVVLTGGNIDARELDRILDERAPADR